MKTVLITGASKGIGFETAIKFSECGYNVIAVYNNSEKEAKKLLKYNNIHIFKADVSNECDVENLFDYAIKTFKKIDVLINNAGVALEQKLLIDVTESEFNKVFNVNVKGTFLTTKCAVKNMLNYGGKILNVSSVFGVVGGSCEAVYSASKSAVIAFSRALSLELENSSVAICSLILGFVDTDMNNHLSISDKLEFLKECGLNKMTTPKMVAQKIYEISEIKNQDIQGKNFPIYVGNALDGVNF